MGKKFYFLISTNEHVEASTYEARLDGGAGYVLESEGNVYVAIAVYFREEDAKAVGCVGEGIGWIEKEVGYLYFKGNTKKKQQVYLEAFNNLYGCVEVLSQVVNKLDYGMTQEVCQGILNMLIRQLNYLANFYQRSYPAFSKKCETLQKQLEDIVADTVFCKDLRYVLCGMCEGYISLSSQFSI